MIDVLTKKQRKYCMSRIRSKHTKPEIAVRKALRMAGIKYRLHASKLPGKPDLIIPKNKIALFINGCFWHQHKSCNTVSMPKTNVKYWKTKFGRNIEKQKQDFKELRRAGWRPMIVWDCQIKKGRALEKLADRLNT
jgi:DNA mismatch endonuclease, patch repair protein